MMPRQSRQLANSGIYHVMLRGVNRDAIFLDDEDYERFLHTLVLVKTASGCQLLAYCLMSNHVHLVIRAAGEPISSVMKRLGVRYANWFNRKYGRVGHLFQSRFASLPVENDSYLVTLVRYVWNNPVVAGLVAAPEQYRWSSRRHLARDSVVVDHHHLGNLLPEGGLKELATFVPRDAIDPVDDFGTGPAPAPTDAQVAELLRRTCGARNPSDFRELEMQLQQRTIRDLRTRSVPYARIARVTGLSISRVRRLHLSSGR
jgi:REP element-mobilizing transposase RayT